MPQTDLKNDDSDSLFKRLMFYSVGGAVGGFIFAPLVIMGELAQDGINSRLSLPEIAQYYSPFAKPFWLFVGERRGAFAGGPMCGTLFGSLAGALARGRRTRGHVLRVAMWYGFFFASCMSVIIVCVPADAKVKLHVIPIFFVYGAVLGGCPAFFARVFERAVGRIRTPPPAARPPQ